MSIDTIIKLGSFFTSIVLSGAMMCLCIYKLAKTDETALYCSLMCSIVNLFIPSPIQFLNKTNENKQHIELNPV